MVANYEKRCYPAEIRVIEDIPKEPKFDGYSAVFDQLINFGDFMEKIAPGAFAQTIIEDDIRALFNHDANYVVGRNTNGTLTLSEDGHGLRAVNVLEDTYIDEYLIKKIKRGDITGMSFGFVVPEGGQEWDMSDPSMPIRTLVRVILWDISPVAYPAYPQTEVGIKSAQDVYAEYRDKLSQNIEAKELILKEVDKRNKLEKEYRDRQIKILSL
jgi:HK97 family phage prohead protease